MERCRSEAQKTAGMNKKREDERKTSEHTRRNKGRGRKEADRGEEDKVFT